MTDAELRRIIGHRFKDFRKRRGWTLKDVAAKMNMDYSHFSLIENGKRSPSLTVAIRLASLLEMPLAELEGHLEDPAE